MNKLEPPVVTEVRDAVIIVRFNRPGKRNPLSRDTLQALEASLQYLNNSLKAIVVTGADDIFASGANIRELQTLDSKTALEFAEWGQQLFQRIADLPQVSIAAINGYCMGGALDLALACDIRVAAPDAVFAHPGTRLGVVTGWGGTQRLPRLIGRSRTLDLFLRARRVGSDEALAMGLVTAIADPVLDHALEIATKISSTKILHTGSV